MECSRRQKQRVSVKHDQAVADEARDGLPHGLDVVDLPAQFGDRAVVGVALQDQGENRPLDRLVILRPMRRTLCLHRKPLTFGAKAPGRSTVAGAISLLTRRS